MRTLAVRGYSHLVGGGVRHRGCVLGALHSMHDQPPPIQGRLEACGRLHFGGISMWVEEGLGIGVCPRGTVQYA